MKYKVLKVSSIKFNIKKILKIFVKIILDYYWFMGLSDVLKVVKIFGVIINYKMYELFYIIFCYIFYKIILGSWYFVEYNNYCFEWILFRYNECLFLYLEKVFYFLWLILKYIIVLFGSDREVWM